MSSPFLDAMDASALQAENATKRLGENGAPEYTVAGVGDPRVALFAQLVRGLSNNDLDDLVHGIEEKYEATHDVNLLVDLIVIAFQTRSTRGDGKGEKALFIELVLKLLAKYPQTMRRLVALVPEYGYFKDLSLILERLTSADDQSSRALEASILSTFADHLKKDAKKLEDAQKAGEKPSLSLAAKWAPREGRHFNAQAKALAKHLFPDARDEAAARRLYRKCVADLNRALDTTEVLMSAHRFSEIDFAHVPSLCLKRNRKAFLNEKVRGRVLPGDSETGNRHPDDDDRVVARKKLRAAVSRPGAQIVKGGQLQPHEIAREAMKTARHALSDAEVDVLNAQWDTLRETVREQLAKAGDAAAPEARGVAASKRIDLGKLCALVDVSGSMSGTPMEVAIALGILVSELSAPPFANRILTFEATPRWVKLDDCEGVVAKVRKAQKAPWGCNTNLVLALDLVLNAAVKAKLTPDQIPDLIIFSDMQFDEACGFRHDSVYGGRGSTRAGSWETHAERIQRKFNEAGVAICGQPYPAPRVIFWNLRATLGFPAQADAPNTMLLSGFSPSLLKLVLTGDDLGVLVEENVEMADGSVRVVNKGGPTPYETLRKALDVPAFDVVRAAIAEVGEGPFADYAFETEDGFTPVDALSGV